ncbi:selenoprotein S [Aplochiton taeniatus]
METGDDDVSNIKHTSLENQDLSFLLPAVGAFVAEYGWHLLFMAAGIYFLIQHLSKRRAIQGNASSAAEEFQDPSVVERRVEALEASRRRMQEELDAKAALFRERKLQLEEEKRKQKIEIWESMKDGKSYKGNSKIKQSTTEEATTSASVLKPKTDKKPLRNSDYNPLTGEGGGASCVWRPGRRGPSSGG